MQTILGACKIFPLTHIRLFHTSTAYPAQKYKDTDQNKLLRLRVFLSQLSKPNIKLIQVFN